MIDITAIFKNNTLSISHDGEVIRTINSPNHRSTYKFTVDNKEYYCVFENSKIRNKQVTKLFLYPINEFENNMIEL